MSALPTRYTLRIHEYSFSEDPCATLMSETPFMAFSDGQFVDPTHLDTGYPINRLTHWWKIKAVAHHAFEREGSHNMHAVMICVEPVPSPMAE